MIEAHGDTPVAHGAARIGTGRLGKRLFGLVIPKRVQQGEAAFERLLRRGGAGDREMHRAQIMVLVMLSAGGEHAQKQEHCQRGEYSVHTVSVPT